MGFVPCTLSERGSRYATTAAASGTGGGRDKVVSDVGLGDLTPKTVCVVGGAGGGQPVSSGAALSGQPSWDSRR
jgi:hypothetical protein